MSKAKPEFCIGQRIHHKLFGYHGIIIKVDPKFMDTDEWYDQVARSRPPKDQPWYHVRVHGKKISTYVAQRNLELDNITLN